MAQIQFSCFEVYFEPSLLDLGVIFLFILIMNIKTQPQPKESELKSGLVEIFGGVENFEIYQNLKTHQDRVKYVWESRMVQNLFMAQAHALKNTEAFLKSDRESKR